MSLWTNRYRCVHCSSEMNVRGGMVGTTWMGPHGDVPCPNHNCEGQFPRDFENLGSVDFNNPEHRETTIRHRNNGNGD